MSFNTSAGQTRWTSLTHKHNKTGREALPATTYILAKQTGMLRSAVCTTRLFSTATKRSPSFACRAKHFSTKLPRNITMATQPSINGDLNNTEVLRKTTEIAVDPAYANTTLAIPQHEDDQAIRSKYRPFLQPDAITTNDWISKLELSTALKLSATEIDRPGSSRLKVLVLYGSLRQRSYSRLLAYESARILFRLGCDVRIYDPTGLPVKDDVQHEHAKVQELRELSKWSDGHVWISPEQHGQVTAVSQIREQWQNLSSPSPWCMSALRSQPDDVCRDRFGAPADPHTPVCRSSRTRSIGSL